MRNRPVLLALIDIDGVLANDTHRVPYALMKDWVAYFDPNRMAADGVWPQGHDLIDRLQGEGWRIAYLTGRRDDRREVTEEWLRDNGFPQGRVHMRKRGQTLSLAMFKVGCIAAIRDGYHDVVLYDDDPAVVQAVRAEFGDRAAVHCTWYTKPERLVKWEVA